MHKLILTTILALVTSVAMASELEVVDRMRLSDGSNRIRLLAEEFKGDELQAQSEYEVYADAGRRSLVLFRSEREAGQKMLMLDDQFYLFMPNSRRQIRITPSQRLLGQASLGDVASLRWAQDYRIVDRQQDGQRLYLQLEADRPGLSYAKVDLWLDPDSLIPLQAMYYLASGRLAKEASFDVEQVGGEWRLQAMILHDRIQDQLRTQVSYLQVEPHTIPENWFNPGYLLRANL